MDKEFKKRKNIRRVIQRWEGGRANFKRDSKYLRCSYDFYTEWLHFAFEPWMTMKKVMRKTGEEQWAYFEAAPSNSACGCDKGYQQTKEYVTNHGSIDEDGG